MKLTELFKNSEKVNSYQEELFSCDVANVNLIKTARKMEVYLN